MYIRMAGKKSTKQVEVKAEVKAEEVKPVVKTEKVKASKPKVEKQVVEPVVVAVVPEVVPEVVAGMNEMVSVEVDKLFKDSFTEMHQLFVQLSTLKLRFKEVQRQVTKSMKYAQKQSNKRNRKAGNRSPSGFIKPTQISADLATFLNVDVGTELARTDVTKQINAYVNEHNLKDPLNGRKILPDAKLTALLGLKSGDELSYFNLQKYMKRHFKKQGEKSAPADLA